MSIQFPWPELDKAAFHGITGDFVQLMERHTEADPAALVIQFLTVAGNIMGRRCYVPIEAARHCGNIFIKLVGDTSLGRKGTSLNRVLQVINRIDSPTTRKWKRVSGLSSGEGLIYSVRDEREVMKKGEPETIPGVKDKRLLVIESEFGKVLTNMSRGESTLSPIIRQAWDGGILETIVKHDPNRATYPHISIIGHITPDELRAKLNAVEMANGFSNRYLIWLTKRSKLIPLPTNPDMQDVKQLAEMMRDALEAAVADSLRFDDEETDAQTSFAGVYRDTGERVIDFDPDARALWIETYPRLVAQRGGMLGHLCGRVLPYVRRLALIYGLLDGDLISTKVAHLQAALAIWDYAEASARYIYGTSTGVPLADAIWKVLLENPEGMKRSAILHEIGKNRRREEMDEALQRLVDQGIARKEMLSASAMGGKKAEVWSLTAR